MKIQHISIVIIIFVWGGCSNRINCPKKNLMIKINNETSINFKKHKSYLCETICACNKNDSLGISFSNVTSDKEVFLKVKPLLVNEKTNEGFYIYSMHSPGDLMPYYRDRLKIYSLFIYIKGDIKELAGIPDDKLFLKSNMEYFYKILGKDNVILYEKNMNDGFIKLE